MPSTTVAGRAHHARTSKPPGRPRETWSRRSSAKIAVRASTLGSSPWGDATRVSGARRVNLQCAPGHGAARQGSAKGGNAPAACARPYATNAPAWLAAPARAAARSHSATGYLGRYLGRYLGIEWLSIGYLGIGWLSGCAATIPASGC